MKALVLIPSGDADAHFLYATGFSVESGLYIRYADGDEVLFASPLEVDRARAQSRVAKVEMDRDAYVHERWPALAAAKVRERGDANIRVSPNLRAVYLEDLRAAGLDVEVDRDLFVEERRRKNKEEAEAIHEAQRAAEAAVVEVVRVLAKAEIKEGELWLGTAVLTSERLMATAQGALAELGFVCPDMIIAGSPECALPHFRGEGAIKANEPVIIDIFPSSRSTHYHGDLTRTVVVGEPSDEVRTMHAAAVQALEAGIESIRAGVSGRVVHRAVCQVLVDRGFGTTTEGLEGPEGVARMNHSTGHGVGLEVHEKPGLRDAETAPLREGDVVTVEPGLYLLGLGGVRVEDTGLVTANGFRNFTSLTRSLDPRDYL
ncbi:MAG TPA: Xaa-Pro peptidase family protein [Candidatus Dormibacteraeota bacterium]|jgi:Xaa-Pro aminopeptidase